MFWEICQKMGITDVDILAFRALKMLSFYMARKPDPASQETDVL